jgi:uncharacterized protein (TIGR02466 family)
MYNDKIQMNEMFSNPLWSYQVDNHNDQKQRLVNTLDSYKEKTSNSDQKNPQTFTTTKNLHHNIVFETLTQEIFELSSTMRSIWSIEDYLGLGVSKMWATTTGPGGILLQEDSESSSFLSGIYFLHTPPESGQLVIMNPTYDKNFFANLQINETKSYNIAQFNCPMPEGYIVLFPAHLPFRTTINESTENRYLIHFSISAIT